MENYSIYLPNYTIGPDSYQNIASVCLAYGKTAIAIGGNRAMAAARPLIEQALAKEPLTITGFLYYGGEASYENVEQLRSNPLVLQADMIFAIGGGKALDTCKCLATKLNKPVFTFPTIASTCAACTSVAIMYHADKTFLEPFFFRCPPAHAFIHTAILAAAPSRYLWAGMGDTYAKHYECIVSSRNEELPHFYGLAVRLSRMCVDPILRYGKKALNDNSQQVISFELEQVFLAVIVTTAIASILLTTEHNADYNSGLAHAIFYALTSFPQIEKNHLHGEVVAFGVLILLLVDGQKDEYKRLVAFHQSVGLPTSLAEIEITEAEMSSILPVIVKMPDIRHYAYPVTEQMLADAIHSL